MLPHWFFGVAFCAGMNRQIYMASAVHDSFERVLGFHFTAVVDGTTQVLMTMLIGESANGGVCGALGALEYLL